MEVEDRLLKFRKEAATKNQQDSNLKYSKGAYVQILTGKHQDEYGQIVSFDDGLNRILVKLHESEQVVSFIQSLTRLVSKSDYKYAVESKNSSKR